MSIDLTKKTVAETFVDTIVVEAGTYLSYVRTEAACHSDPTLRPYTRNLAPVFLATITSFTQLFRSKEEKPEEEKKANNFHFVNQIVTTVTALFSKLQADNAKKALTISEQYNGAAHVLKHGSHRTLVAVENPIAKISDNLWNLTQKVKEIDTLRSKEATSYLHCIYAGTIGSTLLSIGLYAMNSWMKTAGKAMLVFTLAFSGYTYYSHRGDQQKISKLYKELGPLGEKIRFSLQFFDDEMKAKTVSDNPYAPLIKEFENTDEPAALTEDQLAGINYPVLTAQK